MIKKYDDAIKNYNELILINPKASFALFRIGFCFEKKRDQSNALKFYKQCLEIDPKMDKAYYRISKFHYRKNNFKESLKYIEKAIRSNQEKSKYWRIYLNCLSKS